MIKVNEISKGTILFIIAASFAAIFVVNHRPIARDNSFVFDEVVVSSAKQISKPISLPPVQAVPLPILPLKVIYSIAPEYPAVALEKGIQGIVIVEANISASGLPINTNVKSSSGNLDLDQAAVASVSQWRFSPATQNGQAMNSMFEVPVRFVWH